MAGIVAERLDSMRKKTGITGRDVAQLLDTTPETVSRWSSGKVEPQRDRLHRLLALEFILDELLEFYSRDDARLWLFTPHRLLSGRTPAEKISEGQDDEVRTIIAQLRDGAYV